MVSISAVFSESIMSSVFNSKGLIDIKNKLASLIWRTKYEK